MTRLNTLAQDNFIIESKIRSLQADTVLPADLLTGRSVVFIYTPYYEQQSISEWEEVAKKSHELLKKAGIDAVAYYNIYDIFSGPDATESYSAALNKRKIKNLIIIKWSPREEDVSRRAEVIVTTFNGSKTFITLGQKAWITGASGTEAPLNHLYRTAAQSGLKFSNYLIIDNPEFFKGQISMKGKRFESYWPDLKIDKLAVPYFALADTTQESDMVISVNKMIREENMMLDSIMKIYPFKMALVREEREEELKRMGFQYILLYVNGPGRSIREMLQYTQDGNETDYISETKSGPQAGIKKIPAGAPVYKFYIKQLYSGNVYLGTTWDASPQWNVALENYLYNLRKEMKVE